MFKKILNEVKSSIVFYSILLWFIFWLFLMINERYNIIKPLNKKEFGNNNDIYFNTNDIFFKKIEEKISKQTKNTEMEEKMNYFDYKPEFFHIDTNIIEFFWSIRDFYDYSPILFTYMLKNTDSILKYFEEEHIMKHLVYKNIKDLKKEILNTLQQFIFVIPKQFEDKLYKSDRVFKQILNKHINKFIKDNNKQFDENNYHSLNQFIVKNDEEPYTIDNSNFKNMFMY